VPPTKAAIVVIRILVYLVPPALALMIGAPLLLSPFVNDDLHWTYVGVAGPVYLGIFAAPGYLYAFFDDLRAGHVGPVVRVWVRTSLCLGVLGSLWATALLAPAWRQILAFALLPISSTLTSALLLWRFETLDSGESVSVQ
jgi:hypothetical protein